MSDGISSVFPAPLDKRTFGAAVVTKTLDHVNDDSSRSSDHDFQQDVLGAKADALAAQFLTGAFVNGKF